MTVLGWLLLVCSLGLVIGVTAWCYWKLMSE